MSATNEIDLTHENAAKMMAAEVASAEGAGEGAKVFNAALIAALRKSGAGSLALEGDFQNRALAILTVTNAKTGKSRSVPLGYAIAAGRIVVAGSHGGGPVDPLWIRDLIADFEVGVEIAELSFRALAYVCRGCDRAQLWDYVVEDCAQFAEYQRRTDRQIPVVDLQPLGSADEVAHIRDRVQEIHRITRDPTSEYAPHGSRYAAG